MAVLFIEVGQDVHFVGGSLNDAINNGVKKAYFDGKMRCSIVKDPIHRGNTNDNTPALVHYSIVDGNKVKLTAAPKGFGSENMSKIKMFTPSATEEDIINFVVDVVKTADANPCPPVVLGVGIGSDFEGCAILSKKALCRDISIPNENEYYKELEEKMLTEINKLNIGAQGFGGDITALKVNIETAPTHIAGLPVAVNVEDSEDLLYAGGTAEQATEIRHRKCTSNRLPHCPADRRVSVSEPDPRHIPLRFYHSGRHSAGCFPSCSGRVLLLPGHPHHAGRQRIEDREVRL
jgi:fumarate hydratase subunit alpha